MSRLETARSDKSAEVRRWWPDVTAASLGAIITILFIVAVTIASELSSSVQNSLQALTGNHWISKGLLALGVFLLTTLISHPILSRRQPKDLTLWGIAVSATALLGAVLLILFFVGRYLGG
jgi:hypothetical protein